MKAESSALRDFTVDRRVWLLSGVALVIGVGATFLAVLLLRLIAISTNLFYYHRFSAAYVSPAGSPLGHWMVVVPVLGGAIVGLMARFGSDKIRGHGIPEAIEAILLNRARVDPKIAILKPISAAIAIGSGGPFGAEGPIIMTGGAFGSLVAQWIKLTDAERTTFSLGSGTSGGVLAPLLMIGGAVGALAAHLGHAATEMQAFWALIGMGAMLAGSLGVPLTAILFSLEITHCLPALVPLVLGRVTAYLVTTIPMPRSIL